MQIYSGGKLQHFIDGYDVHKSNWMRYVNPARSPTEQNTVACQNGRDIYFYTMRPVEPKQELLVWYSKEFSQRLCSQQDQLTHSESLKGKHPSRTHPRRIDRFLNSKLAENPESLGLSFQLLHFL